MALNFPRYGIRPLVPTFSRLFDDIIGEMAALQHAFPPHWHDANQQAIYTGNEHSQIANDANKFAVSVDVSHYKPDELSVNLDGRVLTIEGKQEQKSDAGYTLRSFTRKWTLSEDVDLSSLASSLSQNGHLSIEAPKKGADAAPRSIPIVPSITNDNKTTDIKATDNNNKKE